MVLIYSVQWTPYIASVVKGVARMSDNSGGCEDLLAAISAVGSNAGINL